MHTKHMMLSLRTLRRAPAHLPRTLPRQLYNSSSSSSSSSSSQSPGLSSTVTGTPGQSTALVDQSVEDVEKMRTMQAPNHDGIWSRSQRPREAAMVGPRFEQMTMSDQPLPYSAMDLIHKQPVRWSKERIVSCDGGGGPLGHPRIFINLDKPEINRCTYCGLPFVSPCFLHRGEGCWNIAKRMLTAAAKQKALESHRKHIESLPNNSYPLGPIGDPAEVQEGFGAR